MHLRATVKCCWITFSSDSALLNPFTNTKWQITSLNILQNSAFDEEDKAGPKLSPKQPKTTSGAFTFRLRVALRSTPSTQQTSDEEEEDGGKHQRKHRVKQAEHVYQAKAVRRVKFKGELAETPVIPASPPWDRGSDSAEDEADSFLTRREQNIKSNKAMVNCSHGDLFSVFIHICWCL